MKYLLIVSAIFIFCCQNQPDDFEKYLSQLEPLSVPIVFKTIHYPERKVIKSYDKALFERYKLSNAETAYGKLYDDNNGTGIIYTVVGDISVPILVMYDKKGKKTDSLNLFENASGFGLESEVYEQVILLPNKTIRVVDSIVKWKLNKTGDDRVEGSEKITIDSIKYVIDRNGKINKQGQ